MKKTRAKKPLDQKFDKPWQLLLNDGLFEKLELARSKGLNVQAVFRKDLEKRLNQILEIA